MTLIDELLYELDGESAALGDAATTRLDAVLAKVRRLDPPTRARLLDDLALLVKEAEADLEAVNRRRSKAQSTANDWKQRGAATSGRLAAEAAVNETRAREEVAAIEQERAEYQATVDRLAEVRALIAR
jgi:signal transduction histidine kinase